MHRVLRHRDKQLDLSTPCIMGILNVTPDSFSDGGAYIHLDMALEHAQKMLADGAAIIDVGGESTRPNAAVVTDAEECRRVIPVVSALRKAFPTVWISVDTSSTEVFAAAHAVGADIWNDVRSLSRDGALALAQELDVPVVLMHMKGTPQTMHNETHYVHCAQEVFEWLQRRIQYCVQQGIKKENIVADVGFGFSKTTTHNVALLQALQQFEALDVPMLMGISRKRFLGDLLGGQANFPPEERKLAGVVALLYALSSVPSMGIVRTHDVVETAQALKVWRSLQ